MPPTEPWTDTPLANHVSDPARLAALKAVALLDTPTEEAFDRLTRLAARFVQAPVSLVTLVDSDRQFFKSCLGLPEPWQSRRETPLSHSFCMHNRIAGSPLQVDDARNHPLFKDNPAIHDLKVVAYLGIPLVTSEGYVLGSFCVIDSQPRKWNTEQIQTIDTLAAAVMTEIELRTEIAARQRSEEALRKQHEELREAYRKLELETQGRIRAIEQLREKERLLIQQSRLAAMGEMISNIAHQWRQPLNILGLLAQELPVVSQSGELTPEYLQSNVNKMMAAIDYMSETIDSFRTFFLPKNTRAEFQVVESVEKTVSLLQPMFYSTGIKVTVATSADPVVLGYSNEYAQVLLNILLNARDAFIERKVAAPIINVEIGVDNGRSVVKVTDNAGGIDEEILERIFDPYFTTKGHAKGTGLGLFMSKLIIENSMGGKLTVRNLKEGAEFRIEV